MIFETIAAIKVANDAIGAVKELLGNVQSIGQIGDHLTKITDAKEELKQKADEGDLRAFMQLEEIQKQEYQLKQMMIYQGRPGLWDDYQKFQATRRQIRENEIKRQEAAKAHRRRQIRDWCVGIAITACVLSAIGLLGYIFYWLAQTRVD
jgi:Na+/phosphate symporter